MKLGAFSLSLAVKDISASKAFYKNLGFEIVGGVEEQKWLILRNGETTIGLFEGMFESNMMTFNPGWDSQCQSLESFDDVRKIHQSLQDAGIETANQTLDGESGAGSFMVKDPDGNMILVDQHV